MDIPKILKEIQDSQLFSEIIDLKELESLLLTKTNPVAYDGFEPSGRMHIAQGILKKKIVNMLTQSGFEFIFLVADWFAYLNKKMNGDMEAIQTMGKYFIEIWTALGMDMTKVKFLWSSKEMESRGDEYWPLVMNISTFVTVSKAKRCVEIMGRKEGDELKTSQLLYPCMQCADIFFLGVDVCQLGMDQRKVNMLAREFATFNKMKSPIILSHAMIPGLKKGMQKMSKSDPENAIFMEDTRNEIEKKISKAYCPPPTESEKECIDENPCIQYFKLLILPKKISIQIDDNKTILFETFSELKEYYLKGEIDPFYLKKTLVEELDSLIDPVRKHFETEVGKELIQKVQHYQNKYVKK